MLRLEDPICGSLQSAARRAVASLRLLEDVPRGFQRFERDDGGTATAGEGRRRASTAYGPVTRSCAACGCARARDPGISNGAPVDRLELARGTAPVDLALGRAHRRNAR